MDCAIDRHILLLELLSSKCAAFYGQSLRPFSFFFSLCLYAVNLGKRMLEYSTSAFNDAL